MKLKIVQVFLTSFFFGFVGIAILILLIKSLYTGFGREDSYFQVALMALGFYFYPKMKTLLKEGVDMHDSKK
ncbi:hypothetical protein AB1I63_00335 [Streptococcus pneumoniae]